MKTKTYKYEYKSRSSVYDTIKFDSQLELKVYKLLKLIPNTDLRVHTKIGRKNWHIDFAISANDIKSATILADIRSLDTQYNGMLADLYIEAKGVVTAQFIKRVIELDFNNPTLLDKTIFVGIQLDAVAWFSTKKNKIITKPIIPIAYLSAIIKESI